MDLTGLDPLGLRDVEPPLRIPNYMLLLSYPRANGLPWEEENIDSYPLIAHTQI